jgi:hypothetical protein
MNEINRNLVIECLSELSNRRIQESLWMGKIANQQSSFEESVEGLFTDSGLGDKLTKRTTGFSTELEMKLRELEREVAQIDSKGGPRKVLNDPAMQRVRDLAANVLELLKHERK